MILKGMKYAYLFFGIISLVFAVRCFLAILEEGGVWWAPFLIITGVGVCMTTAFAVSPYRQIRYSRTLNNGKGGTGTYLKHRLTYYIGTGRTAIYKVTFLFRNDEDQIIEITTESIYKKEAEEIAELKILPIKYNGDFAVINLKEVPIMLLKRKREESQ